jgi:hypothetical protein
MKGIYALIRLNIVQANCDCAGLAVTMIQKPCWKASVATAPQTRIVYHSLRRLRIAILPIQQRPKSPDWRAPIAPPHQCFRKRQQVNKASDLSLNSNDISCTSPPIHPHNQNAKSPHPMDLRHLQCCQLADGFDKLSPPR